MILNNLTILLFSASGWHAGAGEGQKIAWNHQEGNWSDVLVQGLQKWNTHC